jgi:hypothetical protein
VCQPDRGFYIFKTPDITNGLPQVSEILPTFPARMKMFINEHFSPGRNISIHISDQLFADVMTIHL